MKIIFYCGYSIEEWSPKSQRSGIGGSEEATIEVSRELSKLGHEVTVYNRCGDDEGIYDGVKFENYEYFDETEADILILWREPNYVLKFKDIKAKKILWLHDTISELQILPVIHFLDHIFVLSTYHAGLYKNIPKEKLVVTQNGINLNHFKQKVDRDPYKLVYGSSYDRGLLELLEMWQEIKLAVPEATLNVFYGWGGINKQIEAGNEEFQNFKDRIEYLLKQEGIKHLGRISHDEVAKEFLSAGVWVYPCWFPEISCITAMKAQAGGTLPVITPTAALDQTVKWGLTTRTPRDERGSMPWGTPMDDSLRENYIRLTINALNPDTQKKWRKKMMEESIINSWAVVAKSWEALFGENNDNI